MARHPTWQEGAGGINIEFPDFLDTETEIVFCRLTVGEASGTAEFLDEVVNEINDYREGHVLLRPLLTRLIRDPVANMLSKFKITPAQRKTDKMAANAYAVKEAAADVKGQAPGVPVTFGQCSRVTVGCVE